MGQSNTFCLYGKVISRKESTKFLGMTLNRKLDWKAHITALKGLKLPPGDLTYKLWTRPKNAFEIILGYRQIKDRLRFPNIFLCLYRSPEGPEPRSQ